MDDRMQEVLGDVLKHDSDKLLAQGRFIAEKFQKSGLEIAAPTADDTQEAEEVGVDASAGPAPTSDRRSTVAGTQAQAREQADASGRGR
jgi:hypothetical protein